MRNFEVKPVEPPSSSLIMPDNQNRSLMNDDSGDQNKNIDYPSGLTNQTLANLLKNFQNDIPTLDHLTHYFESVEYKDLINRIIEHKSLPDCRRLLAITIRILSISRKENNNTLNFSILCQQLCTALPSLNIAITHLIAAKCETAIDMPLIDTFTRYFHDRIDLMLHCNRSVVHQVFDNIVDIIKSFHLIAEHGIKHNMQQDILTRLPLCLAKSISTYFAVLEITQEKIKFTKIQETLTWVYKYSKDVLSVTFLNTLLKYHHFIDKNKTDYCKTALFAGPKAEKEMAGYIEALDDNERLNGFMDLQMAQMNMILKGCALSGMKHYQLAIHTFIILNNITKKDIENLKRIYSHIQQDFKMDKNLVEFAKFVNHCLDNKTVSQDKLNKFLEIIDWLDNIAESQSAVLFKGLIRQILLLIEKDVWIKALPKSLGYLNSLNLRQARNTLVSHPQSNATAKVVLGKMQSSVKENQVYEVADDKNNENNEEILQFLNKITCLFLKSNWQQQAKNLWKIILEFKDVNEVLAGVLARLKKNNDYQHLKSLTIKNESPLKLLEIALIDSLKNVFKEQSVKVQEGIIIIDFSKRNKNKHINAAVDDLLGAIYLLSEEYRLQQLAEKRKKLPSEVHKMFHELGTLTTQFKKLLIQSNVKNKSSWSKLIERAQLRSKNTEGRYLRSACKVVNLVEEITQLYCKFDEQFRPLNIRYSNISTEYELFSKKIADQLAEQDYIKLEEIQKLMQTNMSLLKDLLIKLESVNSEKLIEKLTTALDEFVQIFDQEDNQIEFCEDKEQKAFNQDMKQKESSDDQLVKSSDTVNLKTPLKPASQLIVKEPSCIALPKRPPAPSDQPAIQIVVRQTLFAPPTAKAKASVVVKSDVSHLNLRPPLNNTSADKTDFNDNSEKQISHDTHKPMQQPSELTNQELLQELNKCINTVKIQWEKYLIAITRKNETDKITDNEADKVKAKHNITLHFLHFCHGLWLILIALEKTMPTDKPEVYFQLRKRVRDIRSILAKLPKDFTVDALYNSVEIFFYPTCLKLIDVIAGQNQKYPIKEMILLDSMIQKTELYQLCKKSLDKLDSKGNKIDDQLSNNDEQAQYYLLQIGESMGFLHSIAKSTIRYHMDLYQPNKQEDVAEIKMLIIIIGKYAELLQKNYPKIFNKMQNDKMHNYFTKAIHYSKALRHPLRNKQSEIKMENVWQFTVQTESDEIRAVTNRLTSDLNYFTAERAVEIKPVLSKGNPR